MKLYSSLGKCHYFSNMQSFFLQHIDDMFRFVTFYIYYTMILAQFVLSLLADIKEDETPQRHDADERTPLLGNVTNSATQETATKYTKLV